MKGLLVLIVKLLNFTSKKILLLLANRTYFSNLRNVLNGYRFIIDFVFFEKRMHNVNFLSFFIANNCRVLFRKQRFNIFPKTREYWEIKTACHSPTILFCQQRKTSLQALKNNAFFFRTKSHFKKNCRPKAFILTRTFKIYVHLYFL